MHSVYTVIVTYNGSLWIEKCLSSLINSSVNTNIIIIDNKSSDNTVEIIHEKFPSCQLIQANENHGFGKANNIGISMALEGNADYVFLLNQDAWVENDTLEKLIDAQKSEPEFDIISPIHLNGIGDKLDYLFSIFIEPRKCPDLYSDIFCKSVKDKIYPVEFVNAAGWLLTKNCLQTIGGFSPIFYHYGEDDNYCLRAQYHGLKIGVYPKTHVFHDKIYNNSKFEEPDQIIQRQKLVLYSDPKTNQILFIDIYINKMSALKSMLKFEFKKSIEYLKKYQNLKKIKRKINSDVEISKLKGPNFLVNKKY